MKPRLVLVCDKSLSEGDGRMRRSARLYAELAATYDVLALTRVSHGEPVGDIALGPNFVERRIARTAAEMESWTQARARYGSAGGDDAFVFDRVTALNPPFATALREAAATATAIVVIRPYVYGAVRSVYAGPIVFDALAIEYMVCVSSTMPAPNGVELRERLSKLEQTCAQGSDLVLTGSSIDAELIAGLYALDPARILPVAPGFDHHAVPVISAAERRARKAATNLGDRPVALFAGSATPANITDVTAIFALAAHVPEVSFLIAGGVAGIVRAGTRPGNVQFTGHLDDATFGTLMSSADMFVVPGDGSPQIRAKVLDAAGRGIPLVLSPAAAGGVFTDGTSAQVASLSELPARIRTLLAQPERGERQASAALAAAAQGHAMPAVAQPVLARFAALAGRPART